MDFSSLLGQVAPTTIQAAQGQQQQQQLQGQQAQALAAQTQTAQQDLFDKKRSLGISMLAPVLNEPDPTKQQAMIGKLVPMFNRIVPDMQLDPENTDVGTIRALTMSQIPVASQPQYQMQMQNIGLMQALKDRLAPQGAPNAAPTGQPTGDQPPGMVAPGGQTPQQPQPQAAGGNPLSPSDMAMLALVKPEMADALVKQGDLSVKQDELKLKQNPGPQKQAEKSGEDAAAAQKTYSVAASNLPFVLSRFNEMRGAAKDASYGPEYWVNDEGTGAGQQFHNSRDDDTSRANSTLLQKGAQGILTELGPQLAQAGVRGNKFLESIASSASGLHMAQPPGAKLNAIDGLEAQYVRSLKATAQEIRSYGGKAPTDDEIDAEVAKLKGSPSDTSPPNPISPPNAAQQAQGMLKKAAPSMPVIGSPNDPVFKALQPGTPFMTKDGRKMVKH